MLKKLLFSLTFLAFAISFATAQITSVGLIGDATPNEWAADTNMVQDANDPNIWTLSIVLKTGEAKFRADDDWAINWGDPSFPTGTGTQDGNNIKVAGGPFDNTFNSMTGEYSFVSTAVQYDSIGIIGTATPIGDFNTDVNMIKDSLVPWVWTIEIALTADQVKFRADNDWVNNWGGTDFPSGVGVPGAGNIPVAAAGDYIVTFNTASFEYSFVSIIPQYSTIGLIGAATPGLDTVDTDLEQSPSNPNMWSANMTLTDGWAKFRAEDDWAVNWGADSFPTGIGSQGGENIPVLAGEYNVRFNSATGEYDFAPPISIYNTIGVIGTGTGLDFAEDIDMVQDPLNLDQWYLELKLETGTLKFRADNDWTINWGDDGFPTGTGIQDGPDIDVFPGDWAIAFNATTGVYSFTPVSIGLVGPASPSNSWDIDEDMGASSVEGNLWSANFDLIDGLVKFRKDDDWTVNWGGEDFPSGIGTQDGPNISVVAGNYNITINTATGEYAFNDPTSTTNLLEQNAVKLFPNPTTQTLNINVEAAELERNVTIHVMDVTGRVAQIQKHPVLNTLTLDVSNYANGVYFLQFTTDKYILGKKFTVAK